MCSGFHYGIRPNDKSNARLGERIRKSSPPGGHFIPQECESYNLKGKTIIPFATSGGSGMGKTNEKLAPSCPGAKLLHGKVFNSYSSKADLSAWVETLSL